MAYQEVDGIRESVDSAFVLEADRSVRIQVGAYDRNRTLVIDPVVTYATYLGGSSFEQGTAIAVDANGNAYVTGYTLSTDFPTVTPYDRSLGKSGDVDVFVAKLNATGTALAWSTYLGGAGSIDRAVGIAVDASGSAYITGQTASNNFPVSATAWQKAISGGGAFVAKLGPTGNTLAYSTYVAGATSSAIAVDRDGNAYVTGSATPAFVTTPGALQRMPANPSGTGFVLKLESHGQRAGLMQRFSAERAANTRHRSRSTARAMLTSADGRRRAIFRWSAQSSPCRTARKDGFVAKLDSTGSRLVYSTLLGGALDDAVNAIAVEPAATRMSPGETYSSDFPSRAASRP